MDIRLFQRVHSYSSFLRLHGCKFFVIFVVLFLLQLMANFIQYPHNPIKTSVPGLTWMSYSTYGRPIELAATTLQAKTNASAFNLYHVTQINNSSLQLCPLVPPKLVGRLKVLHQSPSFEELEAMYPLLEPGGRFRPKECLAREKVAIVIPYRNREEHLKTFLLHLHPFLIRQQLDYGIYVIEQNGTSKFNRAKLFNIGYVEVLKQYDYNCFIFHDVDLIPEDDRNLYKCAEQPRHMSVSIDTMRYKLPYSTLFGGVSAISRSQMEAVNGFSNEYWGWGGEDDDMSHRIRDKGYHIIRYPANIARYTMLSHKKDTPNPDRYKKLYTARSRFKKDGLNSLQYTLIDIIFTKLYTKIVVDPQQPKR